MNAPAAENLLTWEVVKLVYDEGARYLFPDRSEGLVRVREVLSRALAAHGALPATATTSDFRKLYRVGWADLLDEVVPYEARARVTERFRGLVF